jgi:FAD/FMN-containing dehydrogenase
LSIVDSSDTYPAVPGDAAYEAATHVYNLVAPARPAAAVTARTVGAIRGALRYAESVGAPVRVHTTGHAAAAVRSITDGVLIRTELPGGVEVDAARQVARISAGTRWGAVVAACDEHGLAAPHGSAKTVGAVGYLLRGGLSFYGRKVGLAANSVLAIELVTADGELRRVDAQHDPELFWALRGGGGGFGVVTAVEVKLFAASRVVAGAAYWPVAVAAPIFSAWRKWAVDAPWEATSTVRVVNFPPVPNVPPVLSAGPMVVVDGVVLTEGGDESTAQSLADDLLGPLRSVAEPVMDTWHATTTAAVLDVHMDPEDPVPFLGDSMLLDGFDTAGEETLLRVIGEGSNSPLIMAGLRQLGGAFAVPDPAGGAFDHIEAPFLYVGAGAPMGPVTEQMLRSHHATVRAALGPWDTGRTAPSFVEDVNQPQRHLDPDQVEAVDRVRLRVDPHGVFRRDIAPNASAIHAVS